MGGSDGLVGISVGKYTLLEVLGEGGVGKVYKAEHRAIGRQVAIKVLRPEWLANRKLVMRCYREAQSANHVRHPGIVDIYDIGESAETGLFLVMEYLEGMTLEQVLRGRQAAGGTLTVDETLLFVRQVAAALAAVHAKGVVHRDLKPANIFLVRDDHMPGGVRVKLLDFGIAKLSEGEHEQRITRIGELLGTPAYMSPEQALGSSGVDHRTDIFAMGVVVYRMLSGQLPFPALTISEVVNLHHETRPAAPGVHNPLVCSDASEVILKALALKKEARFGSILEFSGALDQALQRPVEENRVVPELRGSGAPERRAGPWKRTGLLALICLALLIANIVLFSIGSG